MTEQFIPRWAEYALGDQTKAAEEIKLHREFFEAWEALHSLPNDRAHRSKLEQSAQNLVDIADKIRALRPRYDIATDKCLT